MPKITFIDHTGSERIVEAQIGDNVMETALSNDVPGIDADCGGACACATCHVFVAEQWIDQVGKAEDLELEMLTIVDEVRESSRLSCQIEVNEDLDGLVVTTPENQV
ncbi:MAG: 2Fe-2S iron-sulfur cluster binding domain-containing protein [Acidiferrobacterales bacterium]|nr:2Fe-2S iron-sulfur cluster binding domain-containing protein [Acidiferrobacterales bacterium]